MNYNIARNKTVYKYFLKVFYNKTNKKEYELQIWQNNICYTNIIAMKSVIILEKHKERKKLLRSIADITTSAEVV